MKRSTRHLVGAPRVVSLVSRAEGAPSSPHITDPSRTEGPEPGELTGAVLQALAPAIARGLGFDLRAAVRARHVRLLALHTVDGRPLPSDWAIPILPGEGGVGWWRAPRGARPGRASRRSSCGRPSCRGRSSTCRNASASLARWPTRC